MKNVQSRYSYQKLILEPKKRTTDDIIEQLAPKKEVIDFRLRKSSTVRRPQTAKNAIAIMKPI